MQELVLAARNGAPDAMTALWEAVKRLAFRIANQYRNAAALCSGVDTDDLAQCAALGVMEALRGYTPDKGAFTTYLEYHVHNACRECLGLKGRERREHYSSVSLDTPIGGDAQDLTIGDTIPDEYAALAFEDAENAHDNQLLRKALDTALDRLPYGMRDTIRLHDLDGLTLQEAADRQGVHRNTAQQWRRTGFNRLRKRQDLRSLYIPNYHRHKGLAAFKSSWSSVVEDIAIKNVESERRNRIYEDY